MLFRSTYYKVAGNPNTYINLVEAQTSNPTMVKLTVSRRPKTAEKFVDPDTGITIIEEEYATVPSEDQVGFAVTLREIPGIH